MTYTGIREFQFFEDSELANFYEHPDTFNFFTNEYILIKDKNGNVVDKRRWNGTSCVPLRYKAIKNEYFNVVNPLSVEQEFFFDLLQDDAIIGKLVQGGFGTGKTYVSSCFALDRIVNKKSKQDKIIYLRNNVEVANVPSIGALPSDMYSKLTPFVMPLADILGGKDVLDTYVAMGRIIVDHIGFIRGRSYKNAIVMLNEAENITAEIMSLIISRIGENSILIVDGDLRQVDKEIYKKQSGMKRMIEKLKGEEMFGMVTLQKNQRSPFATLADKLIE